MESENHLTSIPSLIPFSSSKNSQKLLQSTTSCSICSAVNLGRYKCPRCSCRTCSVKCSKIHKELQQCDGQVSPWQSIHGYSQFKEETSISDQNFMQKICDELKTVKGKPVIDDKTNSNVRLKVHLTADERFLSQNARLRRIWLRLDEKYKASGSRHERFSDTIFWTCTIKFVCHSVVKETAKEIDMNSAILAVSSGIPIAKVPIVDYCESDEEDEIAGTQEKHEEKIQQEEGEIDVDCIGMDNSNERDEGCSSSDDADEEDERPLEWTSYTVHNIPESIRVSTLLRQFLRPKIYGPVISRSQLDMTKMDPFIRASETVLDSTKIAEPFSESENAEKLLVYLELSICQKEENLGGEEELRYYAVDPTRTILDNLRNRQVNGHPCFVVVLRRGTEFGELELPMISEEEQKQLQEKSRERGQEVHDRRKWQHQRNIRGGGNIRGHYNGKGRGAVATSTFGRGQQTEATTGKRGRGWHRQQIQQGQQHSNRVWPGNFLQQDSLTLPNPPAVDYFPPSHHFHPYQRPAVQQSIHHGNPQWIMPMQRGGITARGFYRH